MDEKITIVDANDVAIGGLEKLKVHQKGILHRAFSIHVKNKGGQYMLQKRADGKYHSAGLWTNTCCGHPRPGEDLDIAAHRRLREETGFDCIFKEVLVFHYMVHFQNGLLENEILHVFVGQYDGKPVLNEKEVGDWKWMLPEEISKDIKDNPDSYTYWYKIAFEKILSLGNY